MLDAAAAFKCVRLFPDEESLLKPALPQLRSLSDTGWLLEAMW